MKATMSFSFLIGFVFLLAACGPAGNQNLPVEAAGNDEPISNSGMGMMGMGGGMMARHHAAIPAEYAGLANPIAADDDSLARGADLYTTQCASCHGDGGMGDGPAAAALDPAPAPIAHTSQMMGDDYLYWRISEGGAMEPFNSAMIAWKDILDEDARWDLINYVQALGSGQVMPRQGMGGTAFDPEIELAQRADMLADAVAQEVITQAEADTFSLVHASMDAYMAEMDNQGMGGMSDNMTLMLATLVSEGEIVQTQADSFVDVHDRLDAAGLMR